MNRIEFRETSRSGISLNFYDWPAENARAIICLLHGLGEHLGRYEHVANFFGAHGFATLGFDNQGHGKSAGKRGHCNGLVSMMDDVDALLFKANERYPGKPIVLYGHSLGGNLALNYVLRRPCHVAGLIATGPWIRLPHPPNALLIRLLAVAKHLLPAFTRPNGLDTRELSSDPAVAQAFLADPLVHKRLSVRTASDFIGAAAFLDHFVGVTPCPMLLMHGMDDRITSPEGTKAFAGRIQGPVTWRPWDGMKHEIHNEPQNEDVLMFALRWIETLLY